MDYKEKILNFKLIILNFGINNRMMRIIIYIHHCKLHINTYLPLFLLFFLLEFNFNMADTVLTHLDLNSDDKIIAIRENKLSDANFILTSLISKTFSDQNSLCLVILHNTLGHYQNVGKRLGYDRSRNSIIK